MFVYVFKIDTQRHTDKPTNRNREMHKSQPHPEGGPERL